MRKFIKWTVPVLLLLLVALVASALLYPRLFLAVDSGPVNGDVIVVLGGGAKDRPDRAAELFKEHAAPRIIVSGYGDAGITRHWLRTAGVPAKAIQVENRSRTTQENAQFTIELLRARKLNRVIIVTSWYHSRRALACFRHYAPEIQFYSRPSDASPPRDPRLRRRIDNRIRLEYPKLLGYWLRYGVCPF